MKLYSSLRILIATLLISTGINAQSYKLDNQSSSLIVDGTSNIHDWTIEAENTSGTINIDLDEGKIDDIENLEFSVIAESLMSGKSGMDKNTYKALNTDKYKSITYQLQKVNSIENTSGNTYKVSTKGNLTIAGVKKEINLNFNLKSDSNKIVLSGEHKLKMTDFEIDPPTAMFGSIKTGDMVKIKFTTQFNK
ncbi:YceI family protein [Christiangramia sediminis]|uniref:YceI family protein n=1 Tax=Christiangramia sediminis TaxID=2881336 RepID=A0A9X1LJJ9_9FLAO|nr:YceI family protein [Christiangramia sediminis]MCB7481546.1 YceI family protein [Christiangramia sediminis]